MTFDRRRDGALTFGLQDRGNRAVVVVGASALLICLALAWTVLGSGLAKAGETSARMLFGNVTGPSPLAARAIGSYVKGCLAGAQMLPVDGSAWQAMRLSRNRNWGHPVLVNLVERLAKESKEQDDWPGLLIGDLAQPRGGPMVSGHKSHQIGLDADIWLMPMPDHTLTKEEREKLSAMTMLADDKISVNPQVWKPGHVTLLKRASSYEEVARIFVHPAIKKALCEAAGDDREWLRKVRPWWGHHYHFHIRLGCPSKGAGCVDQKPPPPGDGCGKEVDNWIKLVDPARRKPAPKKKIPAKPRKRKEITMAQLPAACTKVLGLTEPSAGAAAAQGDVIPLPVRKPL